MVRALTRLTAALLASANLTTAQPPAKPERVYVLGSIVAFEARTRVPMGFELKPFGPRAVAVEASGARVVPLPLTPPLLANGSGRGATSPSVIRQALDDFVAANPGYAWSVSGPLVSVTPADAPADAADWLNATVPSFGVRGATARDALVALRRVFDKGYDEARISAGRTPEAGPASTQSAVQERVEQAQSRRFDVSLEGARVREILDAIVLAHGEASWLVSFDGPAPVMEHARVEVVFWHGSSAIAYPAVVPLRPRPAAPSAPAPRILTLPLTQSTLHSAVSGIARAAGRPIGVRLGPECRGTDGGARPQLMNLEGLTFEQALDLLVSRCPGYEWQTVDGVVNIGPAGSIGKDVLLDSRTSHVKLTGMPFSQTMFEVAKMLGRRGPAPRPRPAPPPVADAERARAIVLDQARPITLELKKATVRAALNAIVNAHGAAWWAIGAVSPQGVVRLSMGGAAWSESWAGGR
jgi:hypothetical protein